MASTIPSQSSTRSVAQLCELYGHKPLSISQFCERYGLSKAMYFKLRDRGEGPAELRVGERKICITILAAAEWEARFTHQPEVKTA